MRMTVAWRPKSKICRHLPGSNPIDGHALVHHRLKLNWYEKSTAIGAQQHAIAQSQAPTQHSASNLPTSHNHENIRSALYKEKQATSVQAGGKHHCADASYVESIVDVELGRCVGIGVERLTRRHKVEEKPQQVEALPSHTAGTRNSSILNYNRELG